MSEIVGVSFTALTVTTKLSLALNAPSLTVTVMVEDPDALLAGVTVTVRLAPLPPNTMFPAGTRAGFDEPALNVRLPAAIGRAPTMKEIDPAALASLIP